MNATVKPGKLIKGQTGDWEVVIGLEVHAQVISKSKLFSGAATEFGGEPNSHVSLVDAAMPGMLPVINEECVRQAIRTGLAGRPQRSAWPRAHRSPAGRGRRGPAQRADVDPRAPRAGGRPR